MGDEVPMTETPDGRWVPSEPLPGPLLPRGLARAILLGLAFALTYWLGVLVRLVWDLL